MSTATVSAMHMLAGDFETPKEYARLLRRADKLTELLVTCTHFALNSAPQLETPEQKTTGLFLGTAFGSLETSFRFLDTLLDDGEGQASPTLFSHSVHNAAAGYISRIFKVFGPSFTITSYSWPFLNALQQATWAIASGTIERAIVTTAELYSPFLAFTGNQLTTDIFDFPPSGAVCWILDKESPKKGDRRIRLLNIAIDEEPCDVVTFLTRANEKFSCNDKTRMSQGILSYAFSLTENAQKIPDKENRKFSWSVKAPFGSAHISLG